LEHRRPLAGDRSAPQPANDLAVHDRCRYRVISAAPRRTVARSLSTESNRPDNSRLAIALATKQSLGSGSIGAQRALRGRSRLGELDSGPPRARPRRRREARSGPERSVASRRSRSLETPIRSPAHASFGTIPALSTPGTAATADTLQFVPKRQRCGLAADFRFDRIARKEPVSARGPTCSSSAQGGRSGSAPTGSSGHQTRSRTPRTLAFTAKHARGPAEWTRARGRSRALCEPIALHAVGLLRPRKRRVATVDAPRAVLPENAWHRSGNSQRS
jgi:hypothetical protein